MPELDPVASAAPQYMTATGPWYSWNSGWAATGSGTITASNNITISNNTVWGTWVTTPVTQITYGVQGVAGNVAAAEEPTQEQRDRWEHQRELERRRREERRARQEAARETARRLLRSLLTEDQWSDYERSEEFRVTGSAGTLFLVRHGTMGNVCRLDSEGREIEVRYCAHPRLWDDEHDDELPTEDVLAAQVLALVTSEENFLSVANVHWRRRAA